MTSLDEKYMRIALRLAQRARGRTSPNPMVGAVVVKDGAIVGRGYHKKAGSAHAEAIALQEAGPAARGADLYVTLEPCSHHDKRTPPCTPLVVESGIKRVVAAMIDPNPKVSGRGVSLLRAAGVIVQTGMLEEDAKKLNDAFIKHISTGMPFVTLKIAQTLDGKIATASGESKWITGEKAREEGRRLRSSHDAILVGINTVLKDDPQLTCRIQKGRDPIRIIVDSKLRLPLQARVLAQKCAQTIVATIASASLSKRKKLEQAGAIVVIAKSSNGRVDLRDLMKKLAKRDIISVLMEGGSEIHASALQAGIVDKAVFFIAPMLMTGRDSLCSIGGISPRKLSKAVKLTNISSKFIGDDLMVTGYIRQGKNSAANS